MVELNANGLYCAQGDFYIDPWRPVARALLTHGHSDHARAGSTAYLAADPSLQILQQRLGMSAAISTLAYGKSTIINGVKISFHPAGHILGSAQIRLEYKGEVWVISGDYKVASDPTCAAFEAVSCHTFITEATFSLPIYRWPAHETIYAQINNWWQANQAAGKTSLLLGYALGKAQHLLAGLNPAIGPIYTHGAVEKLTACYRNANIALPKTLAVATQDKKTPWHQGIVIAPPSALGTPWMKRFGKISTGFASGWMLVRGAKRRRAVDRGFVLSDHADWPGLLAAIEATGAERILVTHGNAAILVRYLSEQGKQAQALAAQYDDADLA